MFGNLRYKLKFKLMQSDSNRLGYYPSQIFLPFDIRIRWTYLNIDKVSGIFLYDIQFLSSDWILNFHWFPLDVQGCTIHLESYRYICIINIPSRFVFCRTKLTTCETKTYYIIIDNTTAECPSTYIINRVFDCKKKKHYMKTITKQHKIKSIKQTKQSIYGEHR
jgi:hypothetical protein